MIVIRVSLCGFGQPKPSSFFFAGCDVYYSSRRKHRECIVNFSGFQITKLEPRHVAAVHCGSGEVDATAQDACYKPATQPQVSSNFHREIKISKALRT